MISVIFWILFGALIGWIAAIMDTEEGRTLLYKNILLGIAGSVAGGVAGRALESSSAYALGSLSMLMAIGGASLIIMAAQSWNRRTS